MFYSKKLKSLFLIGLATNIVAQTLPGDTSLPSSSLEMQALIDKGDCAQCTYSVEDFLRPAEIDNVSISPDGLYMAYLAPVNNRMNVFVKGIKDKQARQITFATERDIRSYFWKDNQILFLQDKGGDENFHIFLAKRDGSGTKDLTPFERVRAEIISDTPTQKGEVLITLNKNNPTFFEPYRLDIETGNLQQVDTVKNQESAHWFADSEGRILIKIVQIGTDHYYYYRKTETNAYDFLFKTALLDSFEPLWIDKKQPNLLYASSNLNSNTATLIQYDLHKKAVHKVILEDPIFDIGSMGTALRTSELRGVVTHLSYQQEKRKTVFFDTQTKKHFDFIQTQLPLGSILRLASQSYDEKTWIVHAFSDQNPGSYYLYDATKKKLEKFAQVKSWLDASNLSQTESFWFESRDGLKIQAYITFPKGKEPKKLPLVLNPHGGPWARDIWAYNGQNQILASRGYAVLQVNYRGSTSFGRAMMEKSFKEWGKNMQNDLTDAVAYAIAKGWADEKRIAIYGGSYGGYATLAGVAFTPNLYACAIDYVGVSNLLTFMKTIPPYWQAFLAEIYLKVGNPETEKENLMATSPFYHADKIKTPLFVVQGANDPRVNIDESDQIVRALREKGVQVPYLVKYNEGHGFHNVENQIEFYKAMLGFLAIHIQ